MTLRIETCTGERAAPYFGDLAQLRIRVFRDFPYLYDGDEDYERRYLATYAQAPDSLFVLALDGGRVVGASTGVPLDRETEAVRAPWAAAGVDPAGVFYFGESVLMPEYRGLGLGHRFFDEREAYARSLGRFGRTSFCAVERDAGDPRCPADYRPLHAFWRRRGYERREGLSCRMHWKEVGGDAEIEHRLTFWSRPLRSS